MRRRATAAALLLALLLEAGLSARVAAIDAGRDEPHARGEVAAEGSSAEFEAVEHAELEVAVATPTPVPEWRLKEQRERRAKEEQKRRSALAEAAYREGRRLQISDPVAASARLREAGELGHAYAPAELAVHYVLGYGVEADERRALELYTEAARRGSLLAHIALAVRHAFAVGTPADCAQACAYYLPVSRTAVSASSKQASGESGSRRERAAQAKEEMPRLSEVRGGALGRFLGRALGPGAAGALLGGAGRAQQRMHDMLHYAEARAEAGGAPHYALAIGQAHRYGMHGFARDPRRAAQFFQRAAAAPNPDPLAFVHLGEMHEQGLGVPASNVTAMDMYRRAADLGSPLGWDRIGQMHMHGKGVPVDPASALRSFRRALGAPEEPRPDGEEPALGPLEAWGPDPGEGGGPAPPPGHGDAVYNLARLYYYGMGVERNETAAGRLLQRAAGRGHRLSMHLYGRLQADALARAAAEGRAPDELALPCARAVRWLRASPNAVRDGVEAWLGGDELFGLIRLVTAAEMGLEAGLVNAAHALLHLSRGAAANFTADLGELAREYLERAGAQGSAEALVLLGDLEHARGRRAAAALLYRSAADAPADAVRGVLAALGADALQHVAGASSGKNGLAWRARAAYNLGFMSQFGAGVPQSIAQAAHWYRLAAALHPVGAFLPRAMLRLLPVQSVVHEIRSATAALPDEVRAAAKSILLIHLFVQALLLSWLCAALWRMRHLQGVDQALRRGERPHVPPWPAALAA
eukprot:tig00021721_g23213.t1